MSANKSLTLRAPVCALLITSLITGCTNTPTINSDDPWESWNRGTQTFNDGFSQTIVKPISAGYSGIVPAFVSESIYNFLSNMNDIGVTINDVLQFKMAQGGMDASRFLVNTSLGIAGFIDVADMIGLPKHNEDFGQTLGVWGVPSGNYLVLPFLGASSPREVAGFLGDMLLNPLTYTVIFAGSSAVFTAINAGTKTAKIFGAETDWIMPGKNADGTFSDHYEFIKNTYQQRREYLVNDGLVLDDFEFQIEPVAENTDKQPHIELLKPAIEITEQSRTEIINDMRAENRESVLKPTGKYGLTIINMKNEWYAKRKASQFIDEGIYAEVIIREGANHKKYQLKVGGFKTKAEAKENKSRIKELLEFDRG